LPHVLSFSQPAVPRLHYRDHQGNNVQHFDIPGDHNQLVIVAESVVEQQVLPDVPAFLSPDAGMLSTISSKLAITGRCCCQRVRRRNTGPHAARYANGRHPSRRPSHAGAGIDQRLYDYFDYEPRSTRVDSPIDEAIVSGKASVRTSPTP